MKISASFILFLFYISTYGQVGPTRNWVDSEAKYTDSTGNSVMFTNSLPKGGGLKYYNGKKYSYVIFWTRIQNQSATQLELQIKFPDITFFQSPESHIKIVLPKDTMTNDKIQLFDYGLTNLQSLLNDESKQLSVMQKKVPPKEDYFFYVPVFIHQDNRGTARAALVFKGKNLFYKITIGSDSALIPCGSLVLGSKKLK
jgi:hypothetical protein